jgi:hypothetical protein
MIQALMLSIQNCGSKVRKNKYPEDLIGFCRLALILIFLLSTSGCVSLPPVEKFTLSAEAKIGIFVEIKGKPTHTHVGTTAFNQFNTEYPLDWELNEKINDELNRLLVKAGMFSIDLKEKGFKSADLDYLVVVDANKKWVVSKNNEEVFSKLKSGLGLSAVIKITDMGEHLVGSECGSFGCTDRYAYGYGLYSRSFFGMDQYMAVPGIMSSVYVMDPPGNVSFSGELEQYASVRSRIILLEDFKDPKDFKSLTDEEWRPVHEAINKRVSELLTHIAKRLQSG